MRPATSKKEMEKLAEKEGITMVVTEVSNPPPRSGEFPPSLGDVFCQLGFINLRPLSR